MLDEPAQYESAPTPRRRRTFAVVAIAGGALAIVVAASLYSGAPSVAPEPTTTITPSATELPAATSTTIEIRDELQAELREVDVAEYLRATSLDAVDSLRAEMIDAIWPDGRSQMHRRPSEVNRGVSDRAFEDVPNLARLDELVVRMKHGLQSHAYLFHAAANESCLMLYHEGHNASFDQRRPVIERLLAEGCDVVALDMPVTGPRNNHVVAETDRGPVMVVTHDYMRVLESPTFDPISYFVEPIAAALNHAIATQDYAHVGMMGLSGGGWATTVYAGLDPRIERSYPVAGSQPMFLRTWVPQDSWGDYEQMHDIFDIAGYMDLYVMATDRARSQIQVLNQYDACCFSGRKWEVYEPAVAYAAMSIGGEYRVHVTKSANHEITSDALDLIVSDFLG